MVLERLSLLSLLIIISSSLIVRPVAADIHCDNARAITVRITSQDNSGSGFIVGRHGSRYTLATSAHVLPSWSNEGSTIYIHTHNGSSYIADIMSRLDHGTRTASDIAFLQFSSPQQYRTAAFEPADHGMQVFAAGYPVELNSHGDTTQARINCTEISNITRVLQGAMKNGYQVGTDLPIRNGMSGGPLVNPISGNVVGMGGMSQPIMQINPDLFLYRDGRRVLEDASVQPPASLDEFVNLSWFIPSSSIVYFSPGGLGLSLENRSDSRAIFN